MRQFFLFFFLFPLCGFSQISSILTEAESKELWNTPQWQKLMHYKNGESTIDSPAFFNSENGKTNLKEELIETLKSFASPAISEHEETINLQSDITQTFLHQHPQCAFRARYNWLATQLDLSSIKKQPCPAYKKWIKKVQPHQATLVFASAYLNQPSSLFGHTFLRFDRKNKNELLLSYISNFGAITPEKPNGFAYAYNGLTGGYPGVFSFQPYFEKVKSYGAIENRDLWEYNLNLSPTEIQRLADHIWELGYQYIDYYFFSDNCSYLMMEVLDVARPSLNLSQKFSLKAIPLDTVREVLRQKSMISDINYRPSLQTKVLSRWEQLSDNEKDSIQDFQSSGELSQNLTDTEKTRVIEISYDTLQYDLSKGKLTIEEMRRRSLSLLYERNRLNAIPTGFSPPKQPARPDEAHESRRFKLNIGQVEDSPFLSLSFRPAYHTIDDPNKGHIFGAGINFLEGNLRYYFDEKKFSLHHLDIVSITSISPWQATFTPFSWKLGIKVEHRPTNWMRQMGTAFGSLGFSQKIGQNFLVYELLDGQVSYADSSLSKDPFVGAGGTIGFIYLASDSLKFINENKYNQNLNHDSFSFFETTFQARYTLNQSVVFSLDALFYKNDLIEMNEFSIGTQLYF